MSDDEFDAMLSRAGRALRDEVGGESDQAARTRAKILATQRASAQRTMFAMAAAAVLALGLGVPSVWAWSTGRLDAWLGGDEPAPVQHEVAPAPVREVAPREEVEVEPPEPEIVAPAIEPAPEPVVIERRERAPEVEEDDVDDRRMQGVDPAERRAYREAHALHFDARDPAGALGAWERYLDAYPSGRFALEARYNRALCLVRLGRDGEARDALTPFASGEHGSYRQREAAELVEALSE
ncbi:tetratricopeptide repeat protein [Sandaracinus amylolyticus]|uniref:tetratricopeptide repeat protein n=1 Tax=Sandaracinus amylolyticus TaxID=927083 RepID=UPI001F1B212A|nr:hypothetical protein [Sandaracinus amylolyticus]UJR83996.1 Hypothetical protein I5071_60670 [Sandaracinus amylolyticus]